MAYRIIKQANGLSCIGLMVIMAMTGCETPGPDETPRLIMEQSDGVSTGQPDPSQPSGPSAPR